MSTKSQIQALIDANLADASNITATEHRAVETELLNAFYPTVSTVTQADTSILTLNSALAGTVEYELNVCKVGRLVTITGVIYKQSGSSSVVPFFEITNSDYFGKINAFSAWSAYEFIAINTISKDYTNTYPTVFNTCEIRTDNKCYIGMSVGVIRVNFQYFATN